MKTVVTGQVHGIRASCLTGDKRQTDLQYEVRLYTAGALAEEVWLRLRGGPTGFESIQITEEIVEEVSQSGWHACAGTPDRWDELYLPPEQMRELLKEWREWLTSSTTTTHAV